MTKKKPSPQNRIWEKERRERLNKSFEDLQRLLPDHDPNATLTKIEILQKAIELIGKLQTKIKDLIDECHDPLKEHVHEQDNRLQKLLARNDELMGLLRKAKVAIPPCKYTIEEQLERQEQRTEEKENGKTDGKRRKPAGSKKQSVIKKKQPEPTGAPASGPVTDGLALSNLNNVTPPSSGLVSGSSIATSAPCPAIVTSALRNLNGPSAITGTGVSVAVTPALQPTPIMTTSVLITNNGRLLQMPLVTPPASLLIVGNEDVRAKLNLRKRSHSSATGAVKGRPPKVGRFTIKSIDVIPGRIVNGKIPIPPLPRPAKRPIVSESTSASRVGATKLQKRLRHNSTKKARKGKSGAKSASDPAAGENKKEKLEQTPLVNGSADAPQSNAQDNALVDQNQTLSSSSNETPIDSVHQKAVEEPVKASQKEPDKANQADSNLPTTELALSHTDLEEDLFANLQAMPSDPDAHRDANGDDPLSPTAAYLMNFPLVAGGGKAAGNLLAEPCDDENDECSPGQTANTRPVEQEIAKKNSISYNDPTGSSATTENYGSFFNYNAMDMATGEGGSVPITTSSSSTNNNRDPGGHNTSYATIYQSIDTMLEHRPVLPNLAGTTTHSDTAPTDTSTASSSATTFTFTLTSTTTSTPVTTQPHSTVANHFYTPSKEPAVTDGPLDCPANRKPPPVTSIEFTFSLTTTTAAPPRTVQSQYTNSTILATTMTTPSYDTYGYYHKAPTKTSSYSSTFNAILDPLLANCGNANGDNITTEKPATSFTFCLTSTTKTQPSYTQSASSVATAQSTQIFSESSVPKVSSRQQQSIGGALSGHKMKDGASVRSRDTMGPHSTSDNYGSDFHLQQTQQQQSKYDVSWMAEGRQEYKSSDHVSIVTQCHTTSYNQYNHHQQHQPQHHQHQQNQQLHQSSHSQQNQQQLGYEYTSQLINPSIDYAIPPAAGYGANYDHNHAYNQNPNRKSDIFFAHPVGDEGGAAAGLAGSWSSPSKLHDNTYFVPPVTLPPISNGGIELNTSGASCKQGSSSAKRVQQASAPQEPAGNSSTGSSFLSVSQLVDQSNKIYPNNNGSGQGNLPSSLSVSSCQQHKPPNNSYSAEALIGNTTYNTSNNATDASEAAQGRKEKLYDYGCSGNAPIGELLANPSNTATIPFNFDAYTTPGTDYSKSYSFSNQFLDGGNGYGSLTTATPTGTSAGTGLYYGKTAAASSQGSYFHPTAGSNLTSTGSNYHAIPAAPSVNGDGFPSYYLPPFTEKASANHCSSGKHYSGVLSSDLQQHKSSERKSHKGGNVRPTSDYVRSMVSNSVTSSVPSSATSSSYSVTTSSQFTNSGTTVASSAKTQPTESVSYPNYHQQQQHQQEHISQNEQQRTYRSIPAEVIHSTQKTSHQGMESSASYSYTQYSSSSTHSYESPKAASKRQPSLLPPDEGFNGIDTTSYIPAGQSHQLDVASCFNASSSVPLSGGTAGYGASAPSQVPLYGSQVHHHQHPHHHHHQSGMSGSSSLAQSSSGGTITNFNLSTICPEINDKTGRTDVDRGDVEPSVASIMTLW